MISKTCLKYIRKALFLNQIQGVGFLAWDKEMGRFKSMTNKSKSLYFWIRWCVIIQLVFMELLFVVKIFWVGSSNLPGAKKAKLLMIYTSISHALGVFCLIHLWSCTDHLQNLLNAFLDVITKDRWRVKTNLSKKIRNGCEGLLVCLWYAAAFNALVVCFLCIAKPQMPYTYMWNLPKKFWKNLALRIPLGTLNAIHSYTACTVFTLYLFLVNLYACVMTQLLGQIRDNYRTNKKTSRTYSVNLITMNNSNVDMEEFAKIFRTLQILQGNFNLVFGRVLLPILEVGFVSGSVLSIYGSLEIPWPRKVVWILWGFQFIAQVSLQYIKMGQIYETCKDLLQLQKVRTEVKWFAKWLRSSRPICVTHGSFFFIDRSFVLTLWSIICVNTVNLLVSGY